MKLKKIVSVITILALFSENSICVNAYVAQNTQHSKTEYSDYIEKDIVSADNNLSEATSERKSNNSNNILGPQHNGAIPSPINYPYEPEVDALEGESNQLRAYASNDASDVNYYADYYVDGQYTANYFSSHTTSIKNQCFSDNYYLDSNNCWILSTLAAYESAVHKNLNVSNLDLSEEHARVNIYGGTDGIDTDHRFISKISNVSSYSVVGDFEKILAYLLRGYTKNNIIKYGPVCETSSLPFADNNNTNLNEINCTGLNYYPTAVNYIGNVINYPTTPDYSLTKGRVNAIKKLIVDNGNVIAAYYTDENFDCDGIDVGNNSAKKNFSNKNNTQYHYNNYYGDSCNYGRHMVEIVGWDDSIPYNKFNNYPQHNGAFIVKNSYGEHYSYEYPYTSADGFIYLSYDEADRIFDIRSFQTIENLRNVTNIYENDYLGNIDQAHLNKYQDGLSSQNRIFTLSKFDTQSQSELLSKVNINIADKATGFKIFVSCTGNLNNLTEIPIVTNGNFERSGDYYYCKNYAGNYVVDLARTCHITSDSFYVGVEYYKNGGNIIA